MLSGSGSYPDGKPRLKSVTRCVTRFSERRRGILSSVVLDEFARLGFIARASHHAGCVTEKASDSGVVDVRAKELLPTLCALRVRRRLGRCQPAHKKSKGEPVRNLVQRIGEPLVAYVSRVRADNVVRLGSLATSPLSAPVRLHVLRCPQARWPLPTESASRYIGFLKL